jgi:hypothetical protein
MRRLVTYVNLAALAVVLVLAAQFSASGQGRISTPFAWLKDGVGNAITSLTAGSHRPLAVAVIDSGGSQVSTFSGGGASAPGTANLSNVSTSTTSAQLLASNGSRKGVVVYNDCAAILYVKFGTTASATSFTVLVDPGGHFNDRGGFTGRIDGIVASGSCTARVTELQ